MQRMETSVTAVGTCLSESVEWLVQMSTLLLLARVKPGFGTWVSMFYALTQ